MADKTDSVLAVLADIWSRGLVGDNVLAFEQAKDAVAELLAADEEYDNAQFGLARARYNGEPVGRWAAGCANADIRRAKAIAAMRGDE